MKHIKLSPQEGQQFRLVKVQATKKGEGNVPVRVQDRQQKNKWLIPHAGDMQASV